MSKPWTPGKIAALRAMHADFKRMLDDGPEGKGAADMIVMETVVGALAGFVPDLLDEIERLQRQPKTAPAPIKLDRFGGIA